ncbi:MAG TPA: glycosyltransferase [Casimicrobiaceae bacterium]|jgi:glycosyltransferase involved in cell wall biosynthesis|nr:glycosyltransferase [Casimicrobiaceae bacterium]
MAPLVSIVVRSMARPSLADALASIGAQDYDRVEALVVAACGATHPLPPAMVGAHRVRFVEGDAPRSRPQAANVGLDAAEGEWITFLDDDDVLLPSHVSGLMEAQRNAGDCLVVHTLARARFADGSDQTVGQPFAPIELYERNFIHLSMAIVARELVARGCRFDETLEILQDWDFFIQCAQHTRFHFEPRQTFEWRADVGTSGAGGGANQDDARFAKFRDRIYAKWQSRYGALVDDVAARLADANDVAKRGDLAGAEAICRDVLAMSQNDPFALNLLAMLQRSAGRLDDAIATQRLACAVRPGDASLAHNLALLGSAGAR